MGSGLGMQTVAMQDAQIEPVFGKLQGTSLMHRDKCIFDLLCRDLGRAGVSAVLQQDLLGRATYIGRIWFVASESKGDEGAADSCLSFAIRA